MIKNYGEVVRFGALKNLITGVTPSLLDSAGMVNYSSQLRGFTNFDDDIAFIEAAEVMREAKLKLANRWALLSDSLPEAISQMCWEAAKSRVREHQGLIDEIALDHNDFTPVLTSLAWSVIWNAIRESKLKSLLVECETNTLAIPARHLTKFQAMTIAPVDDLDPVALTVESTLT